MTEQPTNQPIEHVQGQDPLPDATPAPPDPTEPAPDAPSVPTSDSATAGGNDDSQPSSVPDGLTPGAGLAPYADEYAVPDPAEQAQLEAQVPDDPSPLDGDGTQEGDD